MISKVTYDTHWLTSRDIEGMICILKVRISVSRSPFCAELEPSSRQYKRQDESVRPMSETEVHFNNNPTGATAEGFAVLQELAMHFA